MQTETQIVGLLIGEVKAQLMRALDILDALGLPGAGAYVCSALGVLNDEISTDIESTPLAVKPIKDFTHLEEIVDLYYSSKGANDLIAKPDFGVDGDDRG